MSPRTSGISQLSPFSAAVFPAHALLVVRERLAEQVSAGVEMPLGIDLDELALKVLVAASIPCIPASLGARLPLAQRGALPLPRDVYVYEADRVHEESA